MRFDEMTPERRREISLKGAQARREAARAIVHLKSLPRICKRGHDLTGENGRRGIKTRKPLNGSEPYKYEYIACKICDNERRRKHYYNQKHIDRGA